MARVTQIEFEDVAPSEAGPGGVAGVLDVERLGRWVRFRAVMADPECGGGPARVVALSATDDDGCVVPVSSSEHYSITQIFIYRYTRWRRNECRSPALTARS